MSARVACRPRSAVLVEAADRERKIRSTMGSAYASVLPEPVRARTITSRPSSAGGSAAACTSVAVVKPSCATARKSRESEPASSAENSAAMSCGRAEDD